MAKRVPVIVQKSTQEEPQKAKRTYIYDNSVDNEDARLLFRLTKGKLAKQYVEDIPEWAMPIFQL